MLIAYSGGKGGNRYEGGYGIQTERESGERENKRAVTEAIKRGGNGKTYIKVYGSRGSEHVSRVKKWIERGAAEKKGERRDMRKA